MRTGQALVLVLLVLAVGLTTGLAVVSRSVTDIATTTTQEESSRSLSAAEAGVESALTGGNLSGSVGTGTTNFLSSAAEIKGTTISSPEGLVAGESATFFLVPHDANGNLMINSSPYTGTLDLCWGKSGLTTIPAIEATVYYKDGLDFKVIRSAFDANAASRNNNFSNAPNASGCPTDDQTYSYKARVNMPASPLGGVMLRARLLYGSNDEPSFVAVVGSSDLPIQGKDVTSTGTTGDTTRKLSVENREPDMSPLLDTAVFSGVDLVK